MRVLNFNLMRNPLNWVIVVLMVIIFNIAVDLIYSYLSPDAGKTSE